MNQKNVSRIVILFALTLSACAAPTSEPTIEPTTGPNLALTITAQAQALQALTQTALAPTSTLEPTLTPPPAFTATPSRVVVMASADTNCRSGPGEAYEVIGALKAGLQAEVVGKNLAANYWIVKNPNNPAETCWLWGQYVTVIGDAASVQEVAAPPTAIPPAATSLVIDRVVVRFDSSSGGVLAYLDVYFYDAEGDANLVDFQLISTSVEITTKEMKDISITPSDKQKNGSMVTGQWACGSKQYDVAVGVVIRDQAGHSSNPFVVNFSCNKN